MAVPSFDSLMLPVLETLADGQIHRPPDVNSAVAARLGVSAEDQLVDFPESGRVIPEFERLGYREVLVDSYRLFSRASGEVMWVVGVWHEAQVPDEPAEP